MLQGMLIVAAVIALVIVALGVQLHRRKGEVAAASATLQRQEALAQLGTMVAGIAHELNTPLGAVCCSLDTRRRALAKVRDELESLRNELGEDAPALDRIAKALRVLDGTDPTLDAALARTEGLVRHLRLAGRGDRTEPELEILDLNQVVEGATLLLRNTLKHCAELAVEAGADVQVRGVNAGLGSIVINLLTNACQAMEGVGRITVTTRRQGDRVLLTVADNGPGVPAEDRERIFAMGSTSKDADSGTGLGLFISRKIATSHRGRLTVADASGGGAAFTLDLPAAPPSGAVD